MKNYLSSLNLCLQHNLLNRLQQGALNFLMPQICLCCDCATDNTTPVCSACRPHLPWLGNACEKCAMPLQQIAGNLCGRCASSPPDWDRCFALFKHQDQACAWVNQLKHGKKLKLARLFGILIANKIAAEGITIDAIIPVPLHKQRLQERGYNQAIEIARHCPIKTQHLLLKNSVIRSKNTQSQQSLSKAQRKLNLQGAFKKQKSIHAQSILVIDDVMTTGSTCKALCAKLPKNSTITVATVSRAC
jgi:ComF family protein